MMVLQLDDQIATNVTEFRRNRSREVLYTVGRIHTNADFYGKEQ